LEQEGWIRAEWGISETNRKVKFYSLTKAGTKQLEAEVQKWEEANALVARFLEAAPGGGVGESNVSWRWCGAGGWIENWKLRSRRTWKWQKKMRGRQDCRPKRLDGRRGGDSGESSR
jgi:hypothetical protein